MTDNIPQSMTAGPSTSPALRLGEMLMTMLADPNIGADKMQVLLQMQREILAERRRESFHSAYAAMAAELPHVRKQGTVELVRKDGTRVGSYSYAKWEDMDEVIRPVLHRFGFALSFYTRAGEGGRIILGGRLLHIDGHSETAERYIRSDTGPGRNDLQAEGSGQSYAKRYTAEALLNIVRRDEDDDGTAAGSPPIADEDRRQLEKLLDEVKTKPETFLRLFVTGCERMEDIPARDYPRLKNALEEKRASLSKGAK